MKKNVLTGLVVCIATACVFGGIIHSNNVKHQNEIDAMTEKYSSLESEVVKVINGENYFIRITNENGETHIYYSEDGISNQAKI